MDLDRFTRGNIWKSGFKSTFKLFFFNVVFFGEIVSIFSMIFSFFQIASGFLIG